MIDDRNKTAITKKVTQAVIGYLDERGCKPIETEVAVADGWFADVASCLCPTQTELTLLKLIERKPAWEQPGVQEWYERARAMQRLITVLVEVKTSLGDFNGDKKWGMEPPTDLAYIAMPQGLPIPSDKLPANWGVLVYSEHSEHVRLTRSPALKQTTQEQQLAVVLGIAIARDHSTRHTRMREFQREIRAQQNEDISRTRFLSAMRAMKSIVEGKHGSVEDALLYHGVNNIPEYYLPELQRLWGVADERRATDAGG